MQNKTKYYLIGLKKLSTNNKIIVKNVIGAFAIKGIALAISFFSTPLFIAYFNDNKVLGVWYTLLSVLVWFLNFDLGIGNGIRNQLTKAFVRNDSCEIRKVLSSGLVSTGCVTFVLTVVGVVLLRTIDLNNLFGIPSGVIDRNILFQSALFVFLALMLRFLLTFVSSIFFALQRPAVNNFLSLCVSVLLLLYVLCFQYDSAEDALLNLSLAYLLISNFPVLIAGFIVFMTTLKSCYPDIKYVEKNTMRQVMKIGGVFFTCQVLYMLIVNTNEFLITRLFGSQYTTEYTFYNRITSLVSMFVMLALTPVWSVVTKAQEEKNYGWLWNLLKVVKRGGLVLVALQFIMLPFLQLLMDIWLGKGIVEVEFITALSFVCFGSAFTYSNMLSTIVCGMARMKLQLVCYLVGVTLKFVVVISLADTIGDWGIVVWSNVLVLLPYCILQQIDLNRYLKRMIMCPV